MKSSVTEIENAAAPAPPSDKSGPVRRLPVPVFLLLAAVAHAAPETATFEQINAACGAPLLADGSLWDDDADAVAVRLGLPEESRTTGQAGYRSYPPPEARFLGARPFSQSMLAEGGKPSGLSFVFANKGDAIDSVPGQPDNRSASARRAELRANRKAIEQDAETLEAALTALLGDPVKGSLGSGREMREKGLRWDWQGHSFLLASPRGEYTALRIVATDAVDAGGAPRVSDAEMKEQLTSRIERRVNGDVILKDIPMVEQGPKGYCVPATWERAMRYMGIPADMYVLAMAGDTDAGGGTSTDDLAWAVKSAVSGAGRRMESPRVKFKPGGVAKFIDEGLPVMWAMFSTKEFNAAADGRIEDRKTMTDAGAWGESLEEAREASEDWPKDAKSGHVCMIIGYNEQSGEVALSDSWGPEFVERWVTIEEAEAVSQDRFYLIRP